LRVANNKLYALDFDGVLCDSAVETSLTGWKAALYFWPKMPAEISDKLIAEFKCVRPVLETGYEAILILRLLFEGVTAAALLADFSHRIAGIINRDQLDTDKLKQHFGETRDRWINDNLEQWVEMNPLFDGIVEKLAKIPTRNCYIITTKQERFVSQILNANGITLPGKQIFGLDRQLSKQQVLRDLLNEHPNHTVLFVEDRLPTLINVMNDKQLASVSLIFADWGYNTAQDKQQATELKLNRIDLADFSAL
jgi:phosphoglycolate phosphatase-like HAD superfamily hydrolase